MMFYLTDGERSITQVTRLTWLVQNSHRIVALKAIKFREGNSGKLIASMKDNRQFHAEFLSCRSILSWLFHPEFTGIPLGIFEFFEDEISDSWNALQLDGTKWTVAGSSDHWNAVSKLMSQ